MWVARHSLTLDDFLLYGAPCQPPNIAPITIRWRFFVMLDVFCIMNRGFFSTGLFRSVMRRSDFTNFFLCLPAEAKANRSRECGDQNIKKERRKSNAHQLPCRWTIDLVGGILVGSSFGWPSIGGPWVERESQQSNSTPNRVPVTLRAVRA